MLGFFRRSKPTAAAPNPAGAPAETVDLRQAVASTAASVARRKGQAAADVAGVRSDLMLATWTVCGHVTQALSLAHLEATAGRGVPPKLIEQAFFFVAAAPLAVALRNERDLDFSRLVSLQALWFVAEGQSEERAMSSANLARKLADRAIEDTLTGPDRGPQRKAIMALWDGVRAYAETANEELLKAMNPFYPVVLHLVLGPAVQSISSEQAQSRAPAT